MSLRGVRSTWGLLGVAVLCAICVSEVFSAGTPSVTKIKQYKPSAELPSSSWIKSNKLDATVSLDTAVTLCDASQPGSLLVCFSNEGADKVKDFSEIKVKVLTKSLSLKGVGDSGKGPCYAAGACDIWAEDACGAAKDFKITSDETITLNAGETPALVVELLYSGRVITKIEDKISVDSFTTSLLEKKLGTCTAKGVKYAKDTNGKLLCQNDDKDATHIILETAAASFTAMTASDKDPANDGTEVQLDCKAVDPDPKPTTTPKPKPTEPPVKPTTAGADSRLGSVFVAATITALGVLAINGN